MPLRTRAFVTRAAAAAAADAMTFSTRRRKTAARRGTSTGFASLTSIVDEGVVMKLLARSLLAAGTLAVLLSGCATYDYGYSGSYYSEPYAYGYAPYGYRSYYYDYGPYYGYSPYYGYGPYGYRSDYYVAPPLVGFDFRYRDRDRGDRDHARNRGGDGRHLSNRNDDRRAAGQRPRTTRPEATSQRGPGIERSRGQRVAPARRDTRDSAQARTRAAPGAVARSEQGQ
jgi:hypothetical protein